MHISFDDSLDGTFHIWLGTKAQVQSCPIWKRKDGRTICKSEQPMVVSDLSSLGLV
jgi:hypothetical protein